MIWTIMPFVDLWKAYTLRAAEDVLQQTAPTRLLLINNGSCDEDRRLAESWTEQYHPRTLLWSHDPQLPSLSATWNRALDFAWQAGADWAFVPNNDVRLHKDTLKLLLEAAKIHDGWFVSAVNAGKVPDPYTYDLQSKGGPDFSCFALTRAAHERYRFDDNLTYRNDLDLHRRYMLGGDGARIFSVNVPYLHFASRTIKRSSEALEAHHRINAQHGAYYQKKWGGGVNTERFSRPFDETSDADGVTTPELQARGQAEKPSLADA